MAYTTPQKWGDEAKEPHFSTVPKELNMSYPYFVALLATSMCWRKRLL